jgi:hypothetical protein
MFWKFLQPLFKPFIEMRSKRNRIKNKIGNVKLDVKKVQTLKNQGANQVGKANKLAGGAPSAQGAAQGAQQAMQQQGGAPGAPGGGAPGGVNPNPPIMTKGALFWKKKICTQCENELDKSWDACPYCAQAAQDAAAAAAANVPKPKTQAFMIAPGGGGGSMQLCGWLVPLQGSQRGELFTLSPHSSIGTDPGCTVVLHDKFMSSKHAEIKAEGGVWVLKDLGSTNGTYVNDKRVDKHELVDNDFVKFGGSLVKFKSL